MTEVFDRAFWEGRYRDHVALWSGQPNPQLVAEVADLAPGTAAEIGCGEGADAIWLAAHGWRVTATDFAGIALDRAREHARALGSEITARIEWVQTDLTEWLPDQQVDLLTAHYVHPTMSRQELLRRLGRAVTPGGTLLVVDHHPTDDRPTGLDSLGPKVLVDPEEIAAGLDPDEWEITVAETRTRTATNHGEHQVELQDVVLRARKRV